MEINRRIAELESVFPLAGVDDGYILSRSGDVTVGWELTLPTAFTVDRASYDAMLRSMASAIRALPDWTMVHRQDIYLDRTYRAEDRTAFLDSAYERHFDGRQYLEGRHYLYLTGDKTEIRITKDFLISLVTCSQTVMITQQSHVWYLQFLKTVTGPLKLTGSTKVCKITTMNHEIEGITAAIDIINLTLQIIQPLV